MHLLALCFLGHVSGVGGVFGNPSSSWTCSMCSLVTHIAVLYILHCVLLWALSNHFVCTHGVCAGQPWPPAE